MMDAKRGIAKVKSSTLTSRNYNSAFWRPALANQNGVAWSPRPASKNGASIPVRRWEGRNRGGSPSRPIFAFAGVWRNGDGPTYAFLTTGYDGDASTHLVGAIHPKAMPVVLHDDDYERWLQAPVEEALALAAAYPSQLMAMDR